MPSPLMWVLPMATISQIVSQEFKVKALSWEVLGRYVEAVNWSVNKMIIWGLFLWQDPKKHTASAASHPRGRGWALSSLVPSAIG